MAQIQLRDSIGQPIPYLNVRLSLGDAPSDVAYDDRFSDLAGNTAWPNPIKSANGYTLYVNERNVNAKYGMVTRRIQSLDDDIRIAVPTIQTFTALSRLVRIDKTKHRMVAEDGSLVYGRGASFFLGYKRHLDGVKINPQLDQLADLGCNLVRLKGSFESLGGFDPRAYGDGYYEEIPAFMERLAGRGIYGLWTACAATGKFFNDDQAMEHIHRTVEQLVKTRNAIFSPVNEQGQHNNSIDRDRFKRELMDTGKLGWMIYDTGSFGVDLAVQPPFGMYAPFHVRRDYPSSVKDCGIIDHTNKVEDGLEIGVDEPYRMGDEGSGDRHDDPLVAREAAGIAYNALYFVAHSMQGERADLLTGNTLDCVSAAFQAMKGH